MSSIQSTEQSVKIWDLLVRVTHWSVVLVFTLNYFVLEPGSQWHQYFGYLALLCVAVRVFWGFGSTGYASFSHISISRSALSTHWVHLKQRNIPKRTGHNPFGWLLAISVWTLILGLAVTGFALEEIDRFFGNSWLEDIHGLMADTLYSLVIIHVVAAFFVGGWGRIALIQPMITGWRK